MATLSVIPILLASLLLTRLLSPRHRVEFLLTWATLLPALLFFLALLLSTGNLLAGGGWWLLAGLLLLLAVFVPVYLNPRLRRAVLARPAGIGDLLARLRRARQSPGLGLVWMTGITLALCALVSLIFLFALPPANIDGFAFHLPRMAYYLQHGNLDYFPANYWAQVVHPKVATVQLIYLYLISGRNESWTQLPQFFAYWVCMLGIYGISRHLGATRRGSFFAASLFGLLIIALMEAVTVQNDLLLTAFIGGSVYFLLAFRTERRPVSLGLALLSLALALGVKATAFLAIPSLLIVGLILFIRQSKQPPLTLRHLGWGLAFLGLAGCLVVLPAGYGANWSRFGDPMGPPVVREHHTNARLPFPRTLEIGTLNLLRYGVDFLNPDGLPSFPAVMAFAQGLKSVPRALYTAFHIDLENDPDLPQIFSYMQLTVGRDNTAFWGVLGCALIWPLVLFTLVKPTTREARLFALAAVVFIIVHAYTGRYVPWRGRYFLTAAVFALPVLSLYYSSVISRHQVKTSWFGRGAAALLYLPKARWTRSYLAVVVTLGCLTALIAAVFRYKSFLLPIQVGQDRRPSVFNTLQVLQYPEGIDHAAFLHTITRLARALRETGGSGFTEGFTKYELIVPKDAVVAIDVGEYCLEYLYFGEYCTRKLIPVRDIDGSLLPIPPEAQWLVTTNESPYHAPDDVFLYYISNGMTEHEIFLRKLKW